MWSQVRSNRRRSILLGLLMLMLLIGLGLGFAGTSGGVLALAIWLVISLISFYSGDAILLASSRARRIEHKDLPALFNVVEEMKIASGCPVMPKIYVIDDPSPNAFATGRDQQHASLAVTSGLLSRLNRDELQGVIAHEMSHVVNRDVTFMMLLGTMLGSIVILCDIMRHVMYYGGGGRRRSSSDGGGQLQLVFFAISIVLMILAPFLAQMIYFAASRKREYLADACGALYTRYPDGLASALEKIASNAQPVRTANRVTAPMYIINPMYAAGRAAVGLFSTHPPTENRIRILRGMAGEASLDAYQRQWQQAGGGGGRLFASRDMNFAAAGAAPARAAGRGPVAAGPVAPAPAARSQEPAASRTAVNDVLWKQQGYSVIDCNCGVRLKVPPQLKGQDVMCPKCRTVYSV